MIEEETKTKWVWAFAPVNASIGLFLTLLPLYILSLGGTVVDVSIVTSAYVFSLIPEALVWGYAVDMFPRRKGYIAFSYSGMGIILLAIYLVNRLEFLPVFLSLFGFISTAASSTVSLLIMERFSKSSWPKMIARLNYASLVGYACGLIIGFFWSLYFDLNGLILASAIFSLLSFGLILKFIKEPKLTFERKTILFNKEVFTHRLAMLQVLFLNIPKLHDFRKFAKRLRLTFYREVPLLYLSVFIFNFGTNIFGTSYVPSLKDAYVSNNMVFLITLANILMQITIYFFIRKKGSFEHHAMVDETQWTLALRAGVFFATGLVIAFSNGTMFTASNFVFYSALGGSFALYNTAISYFVFRTLDSQRPGETLGVYSAFGGIFSFAGTLVSGYLSYDLGYLATFWTAAVLMVFSISLLNLSAKTGERVRLLHDIITYG